MQISEETFFLDPDYQGSLQGQIRQIVASAVLSGRFRPGQKMPSSRRLAAHLGISRITVTLAYNELVASDYLVTRGRSGYFISPNAPTPPEAPPQPVPSRDTVDWARAILTDFAASPAIIKPADWRQYPYPFVYGQPDPELFDQSNWRLCAHQALGRKEFDTLTSDYADRDDPELVGFIASHSLPRRGIRARPDQILVTVGAQNALWMVSRILLGTGRRAVHELPCYPGLRDTIRATGAERIAIPVDDGGLDPEALPPATDVVYVTPSHQSPTTVTMPMERRKRLLQLAHERDFLIVEDDYEFEMSFLNRPSPALKSLDREGRVIYVGSFSKALFPGLRLGYLVGSEPLIREARALRVAMLRHPPGHMMRATANFLRLGHYDTLIKRMRRALHERRKVMDAALRAHGLNVAASATFGGSSYWMRAPDGVDTGQLARDLLRRGVVIEPGHPFFDFSQAERRFYRLAYSSIPAERIPDGVRIISEELCRLQTEASPR